MAACLYQSIFGAQREAFWDLARTSGIVAYLLMWLSVAFGLVITDRMAHVWPGGPQAFDLHQFTVCWVWRLPFFTRSFLLGVQYIQYTPLQILVPFATTYQSFWVGLGQLAFLSADSNHVYLLFSKQIGTGMWRAIITLVSCLCNGDGSRYVSRLGHDERAGPRYVCADWSFGHVFDTLPAFSKCGCGCMNQVGRQPTCSSSPLGVYLSDDR